MNDGMNIEQIGKRMPYILPEGCFGQVQQQVLAEVERAERHDSSHRVMMRRIYLAVAAVAASICVGVLLTKGEFFSSPAKQQPVGMTVVDKAYDNLSDNEKAELADTYENDIYLSMQ